MFDRTKAHAENDLINVEQGGVGNTINITNVNLNANSPLINKDVSKQLLEALTVATSADKYISFICAPNDDVSTEKSRDIYTRLTNELTENGIEFIVGGGKFFVAAEGPYPHLNECNIIKEQQCNSIIIIADDHSTFSQLSLLSHIKFQLDRQSLEMFAICKDEVIAHQPFLQTGPISFFKEILKGSLVIFSECDDNKISDIVKNITRHKIFWKTQRRN
ncbi:hypothetical protein E5E97_01500 [Aeromonas sp. 2692-1]|uniref:hypothetical protein n=1 Tax=Aeromonas sp. 2692-1 TaxID=2560029 RepID=UPI00148B1D74|nr:hypothetical protein [Aeromonas sp. 2692-1]QJT11710.1 hypothetical protein E5E97_01500 [Aeromonas sp. 2692-1]